MTEMENSEWLKRTEEWVNGIFTQIQVDNKLWDPSQDFQTSISSPGRVLLTPPSSNQSMRRTSPKRRKLTGDDDVFASPPRQGHSRSNEDEERTPTSHNLSDASILPFRLPRPPNISRYSSSTASSSQLSQNSSRRSTSPTKRTHNLRTLKKPVEYVALEDNATAQLPADVQPLYNRIYEITVEHERFLPHNAREEISTTIGRKIKDGWFTKPKVGESDEDDVVENEGECLSESEASAELQALKKIESAARDSMRLGRSESAWNLEVHGPLLDLALSRHRCVVKEYVTTAQIAPAFIPPTGGGGNLVAGKMVDFVLVLAPDSEPSSVHDIEMVNLIRRAVLAQPGSTQYINQTQYPPVQFRPISVSIETKASGSAEEGKVQLGVWSAAWHQRMRTLLDSARSTDEERRIITLPLLLAVEHEWKLLYACDRGDRIEILQDMSVGDTKTIVGMYTVMAVLDELAKWSTSVFREWIVDVITSIDPTSA
ncbi:hypothetical protein B0T10DRAFT_494766 [Thelonectria olida]|uniref:PD-(D/E)XK nuclease-like domain-containing protein n=1 Tax=Thelonectria olida TaxID=1576542 RepID=A0A9P9ALH8_9HYPO|nr:hypothetical protein B0T10DRAFT_494766 [Thelonectria olida]